MSSDLNKLKEQDARSRGKAFQMEGTASTKALRMSLPYSFRESLWQQGSKIEGEWLKKKKNEFGKAARGQTM